MTRDDARRGPGSTISTGLAALDEVLGGLVPGDNVVWVADDDGYAAVTDALLAGGAPTLRVRVTRTGRGVATARSDDGIIDATAESALGRPAPLADEIERRVRARPGVLVVVDDLAALAGRWGREEALRFFTRVCPTMLQLGSVAYWLIPRRLGAPFLEAVRQVTQCVLELRNDQLVVRKAESRPGTVQGSVHPARVVPGGLEIDVNPVGGRLARGLAQVRRELGLTQAELAAAGGVTASAVSQAETGARGLSIETLIAMSDTLGVPLDRFVRGEAPLGYQLTRHDRSRTTGSSGAVALAGDASVGLRAFLVPLAAGGRGVPPAAHRGVQLVVVNRGLVQVDVGADRPVLRSGDSLLAVTEPITGWRNLRPEPAVLSWILRD